MAQTSPIAQTSRRDCFGPELVERGAVRAAVLTWSSSGAAALRVPASDLDRGTNPPGQLASL